MSGPSQYEFNKAEDPNDAGALRKALAGMRIGQPGTSGGHFYTAGNENQQYEQFNLHTPPDVTSNTRIIAVLGIHEDAEPQQDGWFVSDFFAFWNIFQGITDSQNWYHCLDLDNLIAKHGRYLHGNPYEQRKVVLDSTILAQSKLSRHPPQYIKPHDLKNRTKSLITAECKAAEIAKENVLILIFGHGDSKNHGIELGMGDRATLKIGEFKNASKSFKVGTTMITTSCYLGGWACNPELNLSTMTAAERNKVSLSWRYSGSIGRACGSMFTTALIQKLTRVGATNNPLGDEDDDFSEKQEEAYAEFTRTVHEHLLKDVDCRGYEHGLTFGAQDDAWSMCWRERTGIPLSKFEERWESLEDWATDVTLHRGDPLNRDPTVTDEQLAEYLQLRDEAETKETQAVSASWGTSEATGSVLGKWKTSGLYGGTKIGLISMVSKIGAEYLNSYQGFDDTGDDGALHNTVRRIQSGIVTDMHNVERVYKALDYRMTQMSTADRYLEMMDVAPPRGQLCCEYSTNKIIEDVGRYKYSMLIRLIFDREILFPRPIEGQGRPFYKGNHYLIAAFHYSNTPKDVVVAKLDALAAALDHDLEQEKEVVKRDPEVTSKRRKLFQSFGVALGNISPSKRWSRGLSLTGGA
ncbi:MAG: hypothetical protein Q9175_002826 [Cornicularia normoerica]